MKPIWPRDPLELVTCHVCTSGVIRPYSVFLCSNHRGIPDYSLDRTMLWKDIEEFNAKVVAEREAKKP